MKVILKSAPAKHLGSVGRLNTEALSHTITPILSFSLFRVLDIVFRVEKMDVAEENDDLEDRWQRMFNEFQNFQAQRRELRDTARGQLDANEKEIDGEILRIRSDQTKQIEAIKEEANAAQRHIEEQAVIEIKRLQEEAQRRITDVQKGTERDVEILKVNIEAKTQELEHKRTSRKRKYEEDNRQIDSEFSSRLMRLDRQLRVSVRI